MKSDFGRFAIVVAHPDDEVLWAGSLLTQAERIVICFGPSANRVVSDGRKRALAEFPLERVTWLNLREAGVFNMARWPTAEPGPYGVKLFPGRGERDRAARYAATHAKLREALAGVLDGLDSVVTHNPWGEYGHEDHVQVFDVVSGLAAEAGQAVWVTGYTGARSVGLMARWLPRLGQASAPQPIDAELCEQLKAHYIAHGCWTWSEEYRWPADERFFPLLAETDPQAVPTAAPVSFVTPGVPLPPSRSARARRRLRRWIKG